MSSQISLKQAVADVILPIEIDAEDESHVEAQAIVSTGREQTSFSNWPGRLQFVAISGILLLAAFVRFDHLSDISLSYDEACSWRISQYPLSEMFDAIRRDAHPPLYYLCLKAWTSLFGNDPATLRIMSILFGLATIFSVWWMIKEIHASERSHSDSEDKKSMQFANYEHQVGGNIASTVFIPLFAAALIAFNPLHIELSQEARPYTLGTLFAVLAAVFLVRLQRYSQTLVNWTGFGVCATGLSMTHYFGLWTVAMMYLFAGIMVANNVIITRSEQRRVPVKSSQFGFLLSLVPIIVCWLPWGTTFLFQHSRTVTQLWFQPLEVSDFLEVIFQVLAGGKQSSIWEPLVGVAFPAWCAVGIIMLISRGANDRLTGLCLLGPLVATLIYSLVVRNIVGVRYFIFAQTFLIIAIAQIAGSLRWPGMRLLSVIGLLVWSVSWSAQVREHREYAAGFPGARQTAFALNGSVPESAPCVVCSPFIFTMLSPYVKSHVDLKVLYRKNHDEDLLSGPSIQPHDFAGVEALLNSRRSLVLWTVDAAGLFGHTRRVSVPEHYQLVSEQRFAERYGYRVDYIIREYRLQQKQES